MASRLFADTATLTGRSLKHVTRSPDTIITTAVMPIAIMMLFVFVLGGAINTDSGSGNGNGNGVGSGSAVGSAAGSGSYIDYMLPGILLITVAMGVSYTSFRLFSDLQGGIFERFNTLPIARSAPLWAHVLTSLVSNLVSLTIVVGVALILGFRSGAGPGSWAAVAGLLILFMLALTWIAVVAGLSAKSVDGASAFTYPLIFLPFLSSAFVPVDSMSGPVAWFAEHQPVTPIVDAIRELLDGQAVGGELWVAVAWCVGIAVVAYCFAVASYRKRFS